MTGYPPEVAALLARGAEVCWCVGVDGVPVILGVAWPLGWDVPRFRDVPVPDGQCIPARRDEGPARLPRPGPVVSPICAQAP
jgi:hypothetical protein